MFKKNNQENSYPMNGYSKLNEEENEYFKNRVDNQIDWYDKKSEESKKLYKRCTYLILGSSAVIPFFAALTIKPFWTKLFVSFLGIITTISQGIINLNDYNTNWIEYRTVCETLKKEKYMYLTRSGVYQNEEERFNFFAERIESIISQENLNWASIKKDEKEDLSQ
ncbi:DUF4231 domain-containing protein [Enterococcus faecium]|nr:DUF4231 domain-containing protein [Enterococcus faecium]